MRSNPTDDKCRNRSKTRARQRRLSTRPPVAEQRDPTIPNLPSSTLPPPLHHFSNQKLSPNFNPFSLLAQVTDHELPLPQPPQPARKNRRSGVCSRESGSVQSKADKIRCPSGYGVQIKGCEIQAVARSKEGATSDGEGRPSTGKAKVRRRKSETAKKEAEASQIGHCDLICFEEEDASAPKDNNPLCTELSAPADTTTQWQTDSPLTPTPAFGFSSPSDDTSPPFTFSFGQPDLSAACKFKFGPSGMTFHPTTKDHFPSQKDQTSLDGLSYSFGNREGPRETSVPSQRSEQRQHQRTHIPTKILRPDDSPTWAFAFLPPPISKSRRFHKYCGKSKLPSGCQPSHSHSLVPHLAELGSLGSYSLQAQRSDNNISNILPFLPPAMTTSITETERAVVLPNPTPEPARLWRGSLGHGVLKPKLEPRHSRFFPHSDVIKAPIAGEQAQKSPVEAEEKLSVEKEALNTQQNHSDFTPPSAIASDQKAMPGLLQPENTEEWRALLRLGEEIAADYNRCWNQDEGDAGFENVDAESQDDDWTVLFC